MKLKLPNFPKKLNKYDIDEIEPGLWDSRHSYLCLHQPIECEAGPFVWRIVTNSTTQRLWGEIRAGVSAIIMTEGISYKTREDIQKAYTKTADELEIKYRQLIKELYED